MAKSRSRRDNNLRLHIAYLAARMMAEDGVADGRLAELARHGYVLRVIEMLATKEHHLPFQEGVPHLLQLRGCQWSGEIDAADLGANMQGKRRNFDGWLRFGAGCLRRY